MIKNTQLAWFLHGKAIPQCHPGGHGLVPLLGQGSSTWCQKLAFLDSSPYPAATPGLYANPPTSHLTLVPDFKVSVSLRDGTVSLNSVAKMLPLGDSRGQGT